MAREQGWAQNQLGREDKVEPGNQVGLENQGRPPINIYVHTRFFGHAACGLDSDFVSRHCHKVAARTDVKFLHRHTTKHKTVLHKRTPLDLRTTSLSAQEQNMTNSRIEGLLQMCAP